MGRLWVKEMLLVSKSTRALFSAVIVIFLCAVILIVGIDAMHLRADESLVYDYTRNDLRYLVTYLAEQDSHPPLWFSSYWLWRQIMGESEFAARVQAAFYSLIAVAIVYRIGRDWFGAPRYGLYAAALLGVNAYFFVYALEIRPYGLIMLLVAASMWTYQRWLTHQSARWAFYYAVTVGLMLYIHYFLFVLMLVQAAYFVLRLPSRRLIKQGLGVAVLVFLIWLPWLPFAAYQVMHVRAAEVAGGNERGAIGAGSTTEATSIEAALRLARTATNGQAMVYAAVLLVGVIYLWRKEDYRLALVWGVGVPAAAMLVNLLVAVYTPRYVVYLVVGLAVAVGAALAALPRRIRLPALTGVIVLTFWSLPQYIPIRVPLRDLYQQVSALAGPDDVLLFADGDLTDPFVRKQAQRYITPNLWERRTRQIAEALPNRRIWFISGEEWRTDETRADFAQVEATHPLRQIIGRCDRDWCYLLQLLEAPPNADAALFGDHLGFRGVDVDSLTANTLSARLWWAADETPSLDYSIGLQLLNREGTIVAQSDGPIIDWYNRQPVQTSQMQPNKIYIDARTLTLPPNLPAGEYQLTLVVYQSWDQVRLTLPDGRDYLLLDTLQRPVG
jgi:4-amino-4-deoxy-L-arabinose transferase-like glycosyltransferase